MPDLPLTQLTLNTGKFSTSTRVEVAQTAIDHLLPVIDAEGGPVPGIPGFHLQVAMPLGQNRRRLDGAAFFQISHEPGAGGNPLVMAIAVWQADRAERAWAHALQGYGLFKSELERRGLWRKPVEKAPTAPWLAVWLTPLAIAVDPAQLQALQHVGRDVAWALIS